MGFQKKVDKYARKMRVYKAYKDGSFDYKDNKRLKPLSRVRTSIEEAKSNCIEQKVKDWYCDIDRGYDR